MSVDSQTLHSETFAEIGDLIDRDAEQIIAQWAEQRSWSNRLPAKSIAKSLRDQLPRFLHAIAQSLRHANRADRGTHRLSAVEHGEQRWSMGWKLADVVGDYQILRIVLIDHLTTTLDRPLNVREVMAVGMLLDEAIASAVVMYVAHDEQKISEAEIRIREVMDSVADGIVVVDGRGIVVMLNPAVQRIFASSEGDLLGRPFQSLIGLSEAYAGATLVFADRGRRSRIAVAQPGARPPRRWLANRSRDRGESVQSRQRAVVDRAGARCDRTETPRRRAQGKRS